ncbi:ubiquitin conjugating enzyme E2 [Culex quinquefasciatus]|uniref:N-terminal E2 ubiquitin-conjugating enzyme n=1 Tax=Culex quinquefasciatus TaxID=7176 RepID=B0XAS6_CULQU|nr:ubiquitin conjugating enzyme E2 [Culex quinquefasciatus]|eukprot:XP_001866748.1 ubiquitin conjugating enzyme E2 [Culex quinquefasciatus]
MPCFRGREVTGFALINIDGVEGTLYEGEHFQLLFKFNNKYPFDSPEVTFIGSNIPVHPHVYSNGHICLSILTDDWSPALSVQSVCLSISSMLSSCREKRRPPDNGIYVKTCNKNPKKTKWWYHVFELTTFGLRVQPPPAIPPERFGVERSSGTEQMHLHTQASKNKTNKQTNPSSLFLGGNATAAAKANKQNINQQASK